MAPTLLKDTPELMELTIGESMKTRTNSLDKVNELGPPDLCYILKSNSKINATESSFHFVLGIDASSSASLAAYINKLINSVETKTISWLPLSSWKITNGIYSCYNAFSKVDMRVEVQIPGGVVSYMIDANKKRCPVSNDFIWVETYVSSYLRAILYDDNYIKNECNNFNVLSGIKRINIFESDAEENEFLRCAKIIYDSGKYNVGFSSDAIVPTISNNNLTHAIVKYFTETKKQDKAIEFFKEILKGHPEIGSVISKLYFSSNRGIEAIKTLHEAIQINNHSYELYVAQAKFLREKGRFKEALSVANKAVINAVTEFQPWELLANLYIDLEEYENALQVLNSCPMITNRGRDLSGKNFCKPSKKRIPHNDYIPTIYDSEYYALSCYYSVEESDNSLEEIFRDVHPDFIKLPGNRLSGTFKKAYYILVRILNNVGWDNLLQYRSKVFIMEEEYKLNIQLKTPDSDEKIANKEKEMNKLKIKKRSQSLLKNKPILESTNDLINDKLKKANLQNESEKDDDSIIATQITPSTEEKTKSITEGMKEIKLNEEKGEGEGQEEKKKEPEKIIIEFDNKENIEKENKVILKFENEEDLQSKGKVKVNFEEENSNKENDDNSNQLQKIQPFNSAMTTKRLCERWLDNMFMVLYEDLKVFSLFQIEVKQPYLVKKFNYNQSAKEWEIYADIASRLGYKNEALDAYIRSFNSKYSVDCLKKILKIHVEFDQIEPALNIINQLVLAKEYTYDFSKFPNEICTALINLIDSNEIEIVQNIATNCTHYELIKPYFEYIEKMNQAICVKK